MVLTSVNITQIILPVSKMIKRKRLTEIVEITISIEFWRHTYLHSNPYIDRCLAIRLLKNSPKICISMCFEKNL